MPLNESYTKFSPSGKVVYGITNYVALMEKKAVAADFHPLMDFLKNSPISYALTASPTIYAEIVQEMWSNADCSSTKFGIIFTIKGKSYMVTPFMINEALHFPNSNFENIPTDAEIISMLKDINYAGNTSSLGQVLKKHFRKEWSYFFDTLSKGFAGKCSSYDSVNMFVLRIAYSLLYGRRIDIGRLLLDEFSFKFGGLVDRGNVIYYARFLMIIANYLCAELSIEDRNDTLQVRMQTKRLFARLVTMNPNAEFEFVLPEHVRVQLSTLSSSPSHPNSLLLPTRMKDVREDVTSLIQTALPSAYHSGTEVTSSVSRSSKRKKTTLPPISQEGNDKNETAAEVHRPLKRNNSSEVKHAETRNGVPVVELPPSPVEENPKQDRLLLLGPARELDDNQHLRNAAYVLKSRLVARLTSSSHKLTTEDMVILANKCYNTLEGLGDDYTSFSTEVNKLIAQHQELEFAAKKKGKRTEWDIKAHYIHQVQFLSEVGQKLSSAQDKLSTSETNADSLKLQREELTIALLNLTEELDEVEERVKILTAEWDQCKEAHTVVEAELRILDAEKEEAHVAFKAINDRYDAAKKEYERMSNHLLLLGIHQMFYKWIQNVLEDNI